MNSTGKEIFVRITVAYIPTDKIIMHTEDFSERKYVEEALRESEQRLKFHFENSPLAVVEWDSNYIVTQWSAEAERMFGWKREETIGKPIMDLNMIYVDDIPKVNRTIERLGSGKEPLVVSSNRNYTKAGDVIECIWYNTVMLDKNGRMSSIMSLVQDITEKKMAEEVLQRDKDTLEKLVIERTKELLDKQIELEHARRLSDIGTLATTVAHELRNPLAAIKMAAHNIKRKSKTDEFDKHLFNIQKKVAESDHIINNLLFYSRLKVPHFEKINMRDILNDCVEIAVARFANSEVTVQTEYGTEGDITFTADQVQMKELFSNILNNAYDAVQDVSGKIVVKAGVEEGHLTVSVEDNGTGIPKEMMDKLFDPFFTTKAKGTGLGLAVCHQIVMLHNGTIKIESEPKKGTTVIVRLPLNN